MSETGSLPKCVVQFGGSTTQPLADPKTKAWIASSMEPTFGYPSLARFSWTTIKVKLDKDAHAVKWYVPFYFAFLLSLLSSISTENNQSLGSTRARHPSSPHSRVLSGATRTGAR